MYSLNGHTFSLFLQNLVQESFIIICLSFDLFIFLDKAQGPIYDLGPLPLHNSFHKSFFKGPLIQFFLKRDNKRYNVVMGSLQGRQLSTTLQLQQFCSFQRLNSKLQYVSFIAFSLPLSFLSSLSLFHILSHFITLISPFSILSLSLISHFLLFFKFVNRRKL